MAGRTLAYRQSYPADFCHKVPPSLMQAEAWREISKELCDVLRREGHIACRIKTEECRPLILQNCIEYVIVVDVLDVVIHKQDRNLDLFDFSPPTTIADLPTKARDAIAKMPAGVATELPCRIFDLENE